jgi:hypothetical protein
MAQHLRAAQLRRWSVVVAVRRRVAHRHCERVRGRYGLNSCLRPVDVDYGLFFIKNTGLPQGNAHGFEHGALARIEWHAGGRCAGFRLRCIGQVSAHSL